MGKIVLFDLETTGVNTQEDRVVQIAMLKLENGVEVDKYETLVDPQCVIPTEASEVHGITNDHVKDAPLFEEIAEEVYNFMAGCDIGGYNVVNFDMPFLAYEFDRCGMVVFDWEYMVADAFKIFQKNSPRDLAAALQYYCQKEIEDAHDAMADTRATQEVLRAQVSKHWEGNYNRSEMHNVSVGDEKWCTVFRKLYKDDQGHIRYGFGKSKDKRVKEDTSYASWMLRGTFPKAVKDILKKELGYV